MDLPKNHVVLLDPTMMRVHERAASLAAGNISVLIVGETGTGKEIIAETIHQESPRRNQPLLRLNCAALSDSLVTSELFGHERGAFTGATHRKQGLLDSANGGTVFLDEVAEMPLTLQAKLLRVIEDRNVTPVGGLRAKPIDIRFVSATNQNLEQQIERGSFRRDFYYRLNGASLAIPPLRNRRGEIEAMARSFVIRAAREAGKPRPPALQEEALGWMMSYHWPGNIRELRNTMERAVLLCREKAIALEHVQCDGDIHVGESMLSPGMARPVSRSELAGVAGGFSRGSASIEQRDNREQALIVDAMDRCCGNQTRAAVLLGMSRGTLVSRLDEYGLPRPRKSYR